MSVPSTCKLFLLVLLCIQRIYIRDDTQMTSRA